ncbi:cation:proton antiporter, partial [Nocardia brasiliensis]|uniref:cation:proton antiporter domain-containing protein n=1 Tax=Nocardia brasiliensis TaxID=37326 RepID=UPI00245769A3
MTETALALIELGAILFALGMFGRLAGRFGMSPIPLYLLGGLAFGQGGFIKLTAANEFGHVAGEIGVVLLLLLLGLEYTAPELMTGLRRSWAAGLVDHVANAPPGVVVAVMLGGGPIGAVPMGGG